MRASYSASGIRGWCLGLILFRGVRCIRSQGGLEGYPWPNCNARRRSQGGYKISTIARSYSRTGGVCFQGQPFSDSVSMVDFALS